jgi:hypothetical protein
MMPVAAPVADAEALADVFAAELQPAKTRPAAATSATVFPIVPSLMLDSFRVIAPPASAPCERSRQRMRVAWTANFRS